MKLPEDTRYEIAFFSLSHLAVVSFQEKIMNHWSQRGYKRIVCIFGTVNFSSFNFLVNFVRLALDQLRPQARNFPLRFAKTTGQIPPSSLVI